VYKTATGIALTARLGDAPPRTFEGSRADLDLLLQQAAEAVYRFSQPYRYSDYLEQHGRSEQAIQVISDLATGGARSERGWAYAEWAVFDLNDHASPGCPMPWRRPCLRSITIRSRRNERWRR
jgi:hypothetical protein